MTTPAITLTDFDGKFSGIKAYVTADVLALINKSETMKDQLRSYQADLNTKAVVLEASTPGVASYTLPIIAAAGGQSSQHS
jgi:hypothetical protein